MQYGLQELVKTYEDERALGQPLGTEETRELRAQHAALVARIGEFLVGRATGVVERSSLLASGGPAGHYEHHWSVPIRVAGMTASIPGAHGDEQGAVYVQVGVRTQVHGRNLEAFEIRAYGAPESSPGTGPHYMLRPQIGRLVLPRELPADDNLTRDYASMIGQFGACFADVERAVS